MKSRSVNCASAIAAPISAIVVFAGLLCQCSRVYSSPNAASAAQAGVLSSDRDFDGDGLGDFAEVHKYFTDPNRRSTAGDGVPDGDWNRRKEFTYTITEVVQPHVRRGICRRPLGAAQLQ
jgi:hypothetical protein